MFCPNCGSKISDTAMFCGNCGWSRDGNVNSSIKKAFNKRVLFGIFALILFAILLIILVAVNQKNGWHNGKYYIDGRKVVNDWIEDGGKWYHIDKEGKLEKNTWIEDNNNWYYVDADGSMVVNKWIESTYYVNENGVMLKSAKTPDGYYVDADGKYDDATTRFNNAKLVTNYSPDTVIDQMDTVSFGSYPQSDASGNIKEPIEWIVLDRQDNKILLLSKYILDCKCYNNEYTDVTWETCTLRNWLNNDFYYRAFSSDEQRKIVTTNVINNNNIDYGTNGGNNTNDKIFCLSIEETRKYFGNDTKKSDGYQLGKSVATRGTYYAKVVNNNGSYLWVYDGSDDNQYSWAVGNSWWWLRSPGYNQKYAAGVDGVGYLGTLGCYVKYGDGGVRPALWVSLVNVKATNKSDAASNLPSRESELRSDNHFYLDNNKQTNTWVYYKNYYYHVDGSGNIQKNQWIELRYVGADGRMYRGRQTPDSKWVGDDGLVVDVDNDLSKSLTIEAAEPDSWYKTQSGLWYYFENDRTTTKKGWFTDKRDNQTYYLDLTTGIMAVGWTTINGSQYYFNESHDNEPNWYEVGGGFYESYGKKVKAYGSMYKNETTPDGKKVDANGRLVN